MNEINITFAKYFNHPNTGQVSSINIVIDGVEWFIPLDPANRHYDEIMRQVNAGTLTIQDAD